MASSDRAELFELLFGDGAYEMLAKAGPDMADLHLHGAARDSAERKRKQQKRQAQIGLASNVLGISAGAQGLYAANQDFKEKRQTLKGTTTANLPAKQGKVGRLKMVRSAKSWAAKPKNALYVAGGAVALQGANLAGDAITNRVLSREAKKEVKKSDSLDPRKRYVFDSKEQGIPLGHGTLIQVGVKNGPSMLEAGKKTGKATKDIAVKAGPKTKKLKSGICKKLDYEFELESEIAKVDTDKRQVFGWASIVERNGEPVVDLQGDYISVEEIEKAAYSYVQKSRKGGNMHQRMGDDPLHVSDMIESFIVTPEKKQVLNLPDEMPVGWWVGYQVHDDETWADIKAGKLKAFSVHGKGKRTPV